MDGVKQHRDAALHGGAGAAQAIYVAVAVSEDPRPPAAAEPGLPENAQKRTPGLHIRQAPHSMTTTHRPRLGRRCRPAPGGPADHPGAGFPVLGLRAFEQPPTVPAVNPRNFRNQ